MKISRGRRKLYTSPQGNQALSLAVEQHKHIVVVPSPGGLDNNLVVTKNSHIKIIYILFFRAKKRKIKEP